ncbi:Replication A 70 kDa DNA-binding subunit isoform A [Micractinium conductrix]|uniref:Replication protein A subunit n=1 Tax=Micractinium conductrix TaxID=554055 RepID=A0A2P6VL02_9CHLO|nr:Replication A 70 kDa DNA-binding subunit isoform A [Micractinium conductrix]|eukprot:PSC74786.1 Replication A 70 kDa DNA-binding subunit isoform A [Micractinium conductrix]
MLATGAVSSLKASGALGEAVALKVAGDLQRLDNGKIKCQLTDGKENIASVFTSQVASEFGSALKSEAVVRVQEGNVSAVGGGHVLIVARAELVPAGMSNDTAAVEGLAPVKEEAQEGGAAKPEPMATDGPCAAEAAAKTPAAALKKSDGLAKASPYATPAAHPTPPSAGWAQKLAGSAGGSASKRPVQPISALNPYNNNWAVKAKVVSKGPKRSFTRGSVFTAEIVDQQGTSIEATFWRDAADAAHNLLEEGKVYIFARGNVKPADKRYSRVRNDYALHFDTASELEACSDDIDTSAMHAKLEFVPIDQLAAYADKKMSVDLVGVVSEVRLLGSVKRKTDQVELSRRDLTILDQSLKNVTVTLWGSAAEGAGRELEDAAASGGTLVMAISSCRVSSYNGVSVSSLQRSAVLINPTDIPEAVVLREWYDSEGRGAATTHVGEGLASAIKRTGSGGPAERESLEVFRASAPASTDNKPRYATVGATFASINADQALYYMANPENNRKVVEQGPGQYYCEYDGTTLPTMVRRYIFAAKVMDESGEVLVQVFNEQAEQLLGMKADELADIREADPKRYNEVLQGALWQDSVLRVKAQAQEYNGDIRQRYSVADIRPVDLSICLGQTRSSGQQRVATGMTSQFAPHLAGLSVDSHAPEAHLHDAIRAACLTLLPGWTGTPDSCLAISLVGGGISNVLFKVTADAIVSPRAVVFRIYGDNTEQFIDRQRELQVMALVHARGFGPRVLATFSNGRIEEWLEGMRALQPEELLKWCLTLPARCAVFITRHHRFAWRVWARPLAASVSGWTLPRGLPLMMQRSSALSRQALTLRPFEQRGGAGGGGRCPRCLATCLLPQRSAVGQRGGARGWVSDDCRCCAGMPVSSVTTAVTQGPRRRPHSFAATWQRVVTRLCVSQQDEAHVQRCVAEANVYALAAHQYWGTWSLLQARWSFIDFDYTIRDRFSSRACRRVRALFYA